MSNPESTKDTGNSAAGWVQDRTLPAAVVIAVVLTGVGLVVARPDVVLVAIPLLLACAWAWDSRPSADSSIALTLELTGTSVSGRALQYTLDAIVPERTGLVQLRLAAIGEKPRQLTVTPDAARALTGSLTVLHSGPQELMRIDYRALSSGFATAPAPPLTAKRTVTPALDALSTLPLPPRLQGLTGSHSSRRPGDGGDFHDISLFAPGDRLRRIDWKATARRASAPGDLYVRRTSALADATVLLVVDSRDNVAENVESWSGNMPASDAPTSMDLARNAAGTLAAAYIKAGDRVGFRDLASESRLVGAGGGARHLVRVMHMIASSRPSGAPERRQRAPAITSGALVVVFSTFLDDEAGRMAAQWRAIGHRVVAMDVLPAPKTRALRREGVVAYRIVMLERTGRIRGLRDAGVDVVRWHTGGDGMAVAAQLRALSRSGARR